MTLSSAILRWYGLVEFTATYQADDGTLFRGAVLARNLSQATERAATAAALTARHLVTVTPKGQPGPV